MSSATIYKSEQGKEALLAQYSSYLHSMGEGIEREYVETRFGSTHVLVAGPPHGKPLFIFQGGNCINPVTLSWFSPLLKKYRVYAPDTVGHPGYSAETRISGKDESFALWIEDLMDHFNVPKSAFIGPSYGGGITLRLAAFKPERISCAVLVSPAGVSLGSKVAMINKILLPMLAYNLTSSRKYLDKIANVMSEGDMKDRDRDIIGLIFKQVKLEQDMPKLTEKSELSGYHAPTLVFAGEKDIFFPASAIRKVSEIIPNLTSFENYDMGHFPSENHLKEMNKKIEGFLEENY